MTIDERDDNEQGKGENTGNRTAIRFKERFSQANSSYRNNPVLTKRNQGGQLQRYLDFELVAGAQCAEEGDVRLDSEVGLADSKRSFKASFFHFAEHHRDGCRPSMESELTFNARGTIPFCAIARHQIGSWGSVWYRESDL